VPSTRISTAKLVDVRLDGYARNLAEGILRMRYRASRMRPTFLTPDQVYEVTIDLWATSHVFLPGIAYAWRFLPATFHASIAT